MELSLFNLRAIAYNLFLSFFFLGCATNLYAQLPGCGTTVAAFPYNEGFEASFGVWSNVAGDDFNWTRDSGGTPSSATGPSAGSNGSTWYMFIETSGGVGAGDQAFLESACFDFTGLTNPVLDFDYHMYGSNIGRLDVEVSTDGITWTNIWTLSGNQSNNWFSTSVSLAAYINQTIGIRFIGTDGNSYRGDAAIDNITIYDALPMQYLSSTASQATTATIENCSTDKEILRVEVVTTGQLTPIDATQFVIRTDGSTLPLLDITGVDVYYTGASTTFSTTNLFGSAMPAAVGIDVPVNGTQTLQEGNNYFWICYDVDINATIGNLVDAVCNEVTIAAVGQVPTVSNPAGNREIIDCAIGCPTAGSVFLEDFQTAPDGAVNTNFMSGNGSSNFNPAFVISGTNFGWFNVANGQGPFDVYDRTIGGLYVGCETTVTYWARGQAPTAGPMATVDFTIFDDNGNVLASNLNYFLTGTYVQFTHTFTSTTPNIRFNVYFDDVGGPGRDLVLEDIEVTQCCNMPTLLPVELVGFKGECQENQVELNWSTVSETNNDFFEIQALQIDGAWEVIGRVQGAGNSLSQLDYTFIHRNPTSDYYRLKQVDFDGKFDYSDVISVNRSACSENNTLTVSPNPANTFIIIETGNTQSQEIEIRDYSGRIMMKTKLVDQQKVDVSTWASGIYFLQSHDAVVRFVIR